ncbi:MAG TPA: hypothetical protein VGR81_02600 [Candidatus Acidoferrales bacterium]|nr:hypothetical protein [Candidatus Acidoferrales bacterium]
MPITIQPYTESFVPAVKNFNRRLKSAGCFSDFLFFEHHLSDSLPKIPGQDLYEEYFLAVEDGTVRGGFALKHQQFSFLGELKPIVFYHFPLSEGIVDKTYTNVGVHMLRKAWRDNPLMFALGMGGFEQPLPRMLKALGWSMCLVPFYFRVLRPFRFLRGMAELRESATKRLAMDAAAFTGMGSVAIRVIQGFKSSRKGIGQTFVAQEIYEFDEWANFLWKKCNSQYAMLGDRTSRALNLLYPAETERFIRVKVEASGEPIGWLVLLDTQMHNNRHFGDLRVASIVDCLAPLENAAEVIRAGTQFLQEKRIDLIISNQSHTAWVAGLERSGFLQGPSNCVFAASPKLAELLQPFTEKVRESHLNRGDGDGPIHL